MFFAAYVGSSMNPTLREPEVMEIEPYGNRPVRVGDVIFFGPPAADQLVVHRVVRVTPEGLFTRGDNNVREDAFLLQPEHIQGQVVAARRGPRRRRIAGGRRGRLSSQLLRGGIGLCRGVYPLLHPLCQALSRRGWATRLLPAHLRPRVVVFHARGRDQFQLLMGRRLIGQYDERRNQWQIQRPFHMFVDGNGLPRQQDGNRSKPDIPAKRQHVMPRLLTQDALHTLTLKDGCRWEITAGDKVAASIVSQLGCTMRLHRTAGAASEPNLHGRRRRLLVQFDAHPSGAECYVPLASENGGVVVCSLTPYAHMGSPRLHYVRLALVFAREALARGGVLLHGALAAQDGLGVILAAPGGTGKTTASNRLPAPWRSLCDDATLVVRDPQGRYWAHPWPTWSRFQKGGPGGTWDVQRAVPLKGIFILSRASEDRAERIGSGQAVSLLVECAGQTSMFMTPGLFKEEVRALHMERFNNLCALARAVPAHVLHISLTGAFWEEIEQALEVRAP